MKKIEKADVLVGVTKTGDAEGPLAIVKTFDPNISHPFRLGDVIAQIETIHGIPLTTFVFTAIANKYDLKSKQQYCWRATEGVLPRYSPDAISWIRGLSKVDIETAIAEYRVTQRHRTKPGAKKK